MTKAKPRATRTAAGDWDYRGYIISQCYRTKRWVAIRKDDTPVFWTQTLRSAKFRIDSFFDDCPDTHDRRKGIDN